MTEAFIEKLNIGDIVQEKFSTLKEKMSTFQERDSGWSLSEIVHLEVNINKYQPIRGSSYIALPKKVIDKRACINIVNDDIFCFKWAIISSLFEPSKNKERCSSYNIRNIEDSVITLNNGKIVNFENLHFPLYIKDVEIFESNNPDISVNVFGIEDNIIIGPFYITREENPHHVNLIFLTDDDFETSHYVWIKNLSRLIAHQVTTNEHKLYFCNTCLIHFDKEEKLTTHKMHCKKIVTRMPAPEKSVLKFENLKKQLDVPFTIYADFECILKPIDIQNSSRTQCVQEHIAYAYSYFIKCTYNNQLNRFKIYSGSDAPKNFFQSIVNDVLDIYNLYLSKPIAMHPLNLEQSKRQKEDIVCHICGNELSLNERVADHCHLTGEYRGPAHNDCNLQYQLPHFIPILFHNLSKYDCHLFVKELSSVKGDINIIPLNKELYISISKRIYVNDKDTIELRFLDSFRFMPSSLDSLAKNLNNNDLEITKSFFQNDLHFNLMKRKGIFPYDYLVSEERLMETQLPLQSYFFNKLSNEPCSINDYTHAQNVWKTFNCSNLLDYLLLYLKVDVLLLTDVFENFRKLCKRIYQLDPCQYYTSPGLSWDAMLKLTRIELELFTDENKHNFILRGIRGGIVQCCKRRSVANNKYLSDYDALTPSNYLIYLDVNNLYGLAMSQYLPHNNFEWVENVDGFNVFNIQEDSLVGYILEVDLDYPISIHNLHNDLPFCFENKKIGPMKNSKLIGDLGNKTKYIIHYKNLQQCLRHGLVLRKIHRILKFNQSDWLKKYIDLNNYHRTLATNKFEENFFKLLNNAVYGKTMENVDKRVNVKLVQNWENISIGGKGRKKIGARALIAKPNFHSLSKFSDNLIAVQLKKLSTLYNKPIHIGFTVLELSKFKMYNFHYDYMKEKYQHNIALNYMDTDSFIYDIQTEDFYNDIRDDIPKFFDTSSYPTENIFNFPRLNKKVLGMMKDECNGKIMKEFIGLRAKMYSFRIDNDENEIKKIKGIKKCVTSKLNVNDFKKCLLENKLYTDSMYIFRSKLHTLYTQNISKVSLSNIDDKRIVRENHINTYAYNHFEIL